MRACACVWEGGGGVGRGPVLRGPRGGGSGGGARDRGDVPVGCHLLDDLLDHVAVVDAGVAGADLDVVVGRDHVDVDAALGRGGEGALVEPEPLGPRAVDGPQEAVDPGLLPGAGWAVEEQVRQRGRVGRQRLEAGIRLGMARQLLELGGTVLVDPEHGAGCGMRGRAERAAG